MGKLVRVQVPFRLPRRVHQFQMYFFCLGDLDLRCKSRSGYQVKCITSRCIFCCGGLGPSVQVPFRLPLFELKGAISAFFLARSINNSASQEENTNLAPFILNSRRYDIMKSSTKGGECGRNCKAGCNP